MSLHEIIDKLLEIRSLIETAFPLEDKEDTIKAKERVITTLDNGLRYFSLLNMEQEDLGLYAYNIEKCKFSRDIDDALRGTFYVMRAIYTKYLRNQGQVKAVMVLNNIRKLIQVNTDLPLPIRHKYNEMCQHIADETKPIWI